MPSNISFQPERPQVAPGVPGGFGGGHQPGVARPLRAALLSQRVQAQEIAMPLYLDPRPGSPFSPVARLTADPVDKGDWTQEGLDRRAQWSAPAWAACCALYSISCVQSSLSTSSCCC